MAPNRQRLSAVAQSLKDLRVVRPKDHAFASETAQVDPCYWDEATSTPSSTGDLFSASHIEENLINASSTSDEPSTTLAENDSYWAEASSSSGPISSPAAPAIISSPNVQESDSYWSWEHAPTASDSYWSERPGSQSSVVHDEYWQWSHARTESDAYWQQ